MKLIIINLFAFICIASYANQPLQKKWEVLFDGTSLENFEIKKNPKDSLFEYFSIEDNLILANSMGSDSHDYVWLYTKKEYDDFELKFKFAYRSDSKGNSGVQIRSRYQDSTLWLDGPQIDIHPKAPWRSGFVWDETIGNKRWIFPYIEKEGAKWAKPEMAMNEVKMKVSTETEFIWNEMRVVAKGTDVQAYINNTQVTDLKGEGILNDAIHKHRQVGMKGHIALQIHMKNQLKIYFKDIYIRKL